MLNFFLFVLILSACFAVQAQNTDGDAKIQAIGSSWELAWNEHDMKALGALFTGNADFVNVGARHWKGRKEIEEQHAARLNQFNESVWKNKKSQYSIFEA